jgi:hypothetical protein
MKVLEPELACPPVVPGDRSGAAAMQSGTRVRILHEEDYLPFPLSNRDFVMAMRHPDPSGPAGSDGAAVKVVLAPVEHPQAKPGGKRVRGQLHLLYTVEPAPLRAGGDPLAGCRLTLTTWFELGGGLPAWFINSLAGEFLKTFNKLHADIPKLKG